MPKPKIPDGCQVAILKVTLLKINRLLPMANKNRHMKFQIKIPKQTWVTLRKPCFLQTDKRTRWFQYTLPPPTNFLGLGYDIIVCQWVVILFKISQIVKTLVSPSIIYWINTFATDPCLGLALLTLSWDKKWDSYSPMNGYPSFYHRIALVAPSPDRPLLSGIMLTKTRDHHYNYHNV